MKINTIDDLAEFVGCDYTQIGRRLYKATECGVTFRYEACGIFVAGYCEGVDCHFTEHYRPWGFTDKEFWKVVEDADSDGVEMWNLTHGCEDCPGPEVNPDCPTCGGDGIII